MNRYVLAGVLADLVAGRRVLVVSAHLRESRVLLDQLVSEAVDDDLVVVVRRANGRESVELPRSGGSVVFRSVGQSMRGLEADVVFVDAYATPEVLHELEIVVAAGGELIRR